MNQIHLAGSVNVICRKLLKQTKEIVPKKKWYRLFMDLSENLVRKLRVHQPITLNEHWLGVHLAELLPTDTTLFLGNSLPIRLVDIFSTHSSTKVYTNRGASGIDGIIATAAGCVEGKGSPLVLLIGDTSFLHDLNSLQLAHKCKIPFIIVLVNNGGGEIFYMTTKGSRNKEAEIAHNYFVMPHGLSAQHAAKMFNVHYFSPQTIDEFKVVFKAAFSNMGCSVIEVITPSGDGVKSIETAMARVKEL